MRLIVVLGLVHLLAGDDVENVLNAIVDDGTLQVGAVSFDVEELDFILIFFSFQIIAGFPLPLLHVHEDH